MQRRSNYIIKFDESVSFLNVTIQDATAEDEGEFDEEEEGEVEDAE